MFERKQGRDKDGHLHMFSSKAASDLILTSRAKRAEASAGRNLGHAQNDSAREGSVVARAKVRNNPKEG